MKIRHVKSKATQSELALTYLANPTFKDFSPILPEGNYQRWNGPATNGTNTIVTYSFGEAGRFPTGHDHDDSYVRRYQSFGEGQRNAARKAFDEIEGFSGLRFVEIDKKAAINLQIAVPNYPDNVVGYADLPFALSDGYIASSYLNMIDPNFAQVGSYGYLTLLHEIGHSVGLHHTFEHDPPVPARYDYDYNSVMTYTDSWRPADSFGSFDRAALKHVYGTAARSRDWTVTEGRDGTIFVKATWESERIHVADGRSKVMAFGGRDFLSGNDETNILFGGRGGDVLVGRFGDDKLFGGFGYDVLKGGSGGDLLSGGGGADRLLGGLGFDVLKGDAGRDVLWGGAGRDRLFGGAGRDELIGGDGADTFIFKRSDGRARDTIRDFQDGLDRITLSAVADSLDDLSFRTTAGGHLIVMTEDLTIRLKNAADHVILTSEDFIF